jgi:hypothetical protein
MREHADPDARQRAARIEWHSLMKPGGNSRFGARRTPRRGSQLCGTAFAVLD